MLQCSGDALDITRALYLRHCFRLDGINPSQCSTDYIYGFYFTCSLSLSLSLLNFLKYPLRNGFSSFAVVPIASASCLAAYASSASGDTSESRMRR